MSGREYRKERNMKFNELKNGMVVTVESATRDGGMTNDPNGWWGATLDPLDNDCIVDGGTISISHKVLEKIVKEGCYEVIDGGFKNGAIISCTTKIRIVK
jgi:hypothetical protein